MDKRTLEKQLLEHTDGAHLVTVSELMRYTGASRKTVCRMVRDLTNMATPTRPKYHVHDVAAVMCGGMPKR